MKEKKWMSWLCSGMTLVELMAAMAVSMILALTVGGLLVFAHKTVAETSEQNRYDMVVGQVEALLEHHLAYADLLEVSFDETPLENTDHTLAFTKEGRVLFDGEEALSEACYNGKQIRLEIEPPASEEKGWVLSCRIDIKDKEKNTIYSKRTVIELANLKLEGRPVVYPEAQNKTWDSNLESIYLHYRKVSN